MRLSEAKIKEAILHPEKLARHEALSYFAVCHSLDQEVMPLAIQAIEAHGRGNAFRDLYLLAHLAQTEATVEWAIRELHREEDKAQDHDHYFPSLSQILCSADPQLVAPRASSILQAPGFSRELVPEFQECLQLASWDADQCWNELERICAEGVRKPDSSDMDFGHATRVLEALARKGEKYIERILDLLDKEVEDFENDPMSWLEIFLVTLAGEMRLQSAMPLIVKKLRLMGEILSEQCIEALGKIGTDAAAAAVAEGWLEAEWDYRIYASGALERIHSDTTVRKCLELLPQDPDLGIRTNLADALLAQLAEEGIEPVRQMVVKRAYDGTISDVMGHLVGVSTVLGVTFPEYPVWKRQAEEEWTRIERRMKEVWSFTQSPPSVRPSQTAPARERDTFLDKPAPLLRDKKKVGRNDPCPCGSGKKFKKCCMNRDKE